MMKLNILKIRKEYVVVGLILLLMLLTLWGWYLKTSHVAVFDAGNLSAENRLQTNLAGSDLQKYSKDSFETESTPENYKKSSVGEIDSSKSAAQPESEIKNIPDKPGMININVAGREELMTLYGIGEVKAQAVVAYREENGFFDSIAEIMKVKGIGQATYEKIKECITIESEAYQDTPAN